MTYSSTIEAPRRGTSAAWGGVLSMALCVAMLIASEFMPVSLLTPMAEGLRATEGQTGQAISISGLFAVAASLLALGATAGVLAWIENAGLIPYLEIDLNLAVFGWGMLIATVFGLLSGVLPAWKMSRLDPVHALKGAH